MTDLKALRDLAQKALPVTLHGEFKLASGEISKTWTGTLPKAAREFKDALSPQTVLALIEELTVAREVIAAFRKAFPGFFHDDRVRETP